MRAFDLMLREDEAEAVRQACEEKRAMDEHPDWTKDQVREDVLKKAYFHSRAKGDFKLGLKTIAADAKLESLGLDRKKLALAQRQLKQTREQVAKLRDVKAPLSDEDRLAIVARIDEIMGIPPAKKKKPPS